MSVERVKKYLEPYGLEDRVQEFQVSSATVELAAEALHVEPALIAKSISLHDNGDGCLIIVAAGDAKIDNAKFKSEFGYKARMLKFEEVEPLTGYTVGGVCPFGNPAAAKVYCDVSLKRFGTIYPAAGSSNSCVRLSCNELSGVSGSLKWVDVCKGWEDAAQA